MNAEYPICNWFVTSKNPQWQPPVEIIKLNTEIT